MGEANLRGDFQERREQARQRMLDDAEVLVALHEKDGKVHMNMLPRDAEPNPQSAAVILAAFFGRNFKAIAGQAVAERDAWEAAQRGEAEPSVIVEPGRRSILDQDGRIIGGQTQ